MSRWSRKQNRKALEVLHTSQTKTQAKAQEKSQYSILSTIASGTDIVTIPHGTIRHQSSGKTRVI